jgi:IS30 family transposase
MKKYNHLSLEQRYQIQVLLGKGHTYTAIAQTLDVHITTISREIKRNAIRSGPRKDLYDPDIAWQKTQSRHRFKHKKISFTIEMKQLIVKWLRDKRWSPEIISVKGREIHANMVSHEKIYQWIWEMKKSRHRDDEPFKYLYKYLKHGRRRRKRGRIKDSRGILTERVTVDKRPSIVKARKRVGDYEVDLMLGQNQKSAILVITDRASIKTKLRKVESKNSKEIAKKIVNALHQEVVPVQTITFDNDKAFALHKFIGERLNAKTYFTRPYSSQEKGTVENRIGVLRLFFPRRKTDFSTISEVELKAVEREINNRPVRKFKYRTPDEEYERKVKVALKS